ncbi:hypothetical protein [Actinomadura sp. GC306]|nr:hypothetical protein [Actinomadura sp. GC306]
MEAGGFRLVGSPVRAAGCEPAYGPPPALGEHDDEVTEAVK